MYIKTLTVSGLNNYIKKIMDNDFILNNSNVRGEISNLKLHSSGHMYFSLKDAYSKINCVMFKGSVSKLKIMPEDGMNVIVKGRVSLYEKEGSCQFYCENMELEGLGELYTAFEKLKEKLQSEGLFSETHKKEIPAFVKKIGVVTSPTGAAIQDIINVTRRRNKGVDILLYPAKVQGIGSSKEIVQGIEFLDKTDVDLIIIARGGGSIEELWSFNDEELAYAVFGSKKPIISGVGHEVDFTIVDFVSDKRAATPSQAAEIAVFDLNKANEKLTYIKSNMEKNINKRLTYNKNQLEILRRKIEFMNPKVKIVNEYSRLSELKNSMERHMKFNLQKEKDRLAALNSLLMANNPLKVLNKGYAIITDDENRVISSISVLKNVEKVNITLKDGNIKTSIKTL
ncbi:MAG: exodeoxyribonuclease VII large subunit [Solirubrobacterales bacterium]